VRLSAERTKVTDTDQKEAPQENGVLKLLLEVGPLIVFFFAYFRGDKIAEWAGFPGVEKIYAATAIFMAVLTVSTAVSFILMRKVPIMPLVSLVLVIVFGAITLYLQDATFIKMKPTILNTLFGIILLVGLAMNRLFLKYVFGEGFEMTDGGWRVMTLRWGLFFIFLAVLNEVIWRNFSEAFWVNFKVWGNLPLTMLFAVLQLPLTKKYALHPEDEEA